MSDRVRIEVDARGIADVCLVRADKMNALDAAMFQALLDAVAAIKARGDVRVVVLRGEGRAFCAGLDMGRMQALRDGAAGGSRDLRPRSHGIANSAQAVAMGWRELAVPVIAAVHGVAFGGGLQLALGADLRYIDAATRMSVMEVKWGLVPDMAGLVLMRRLLRDDVLRELTFTGRIVTGAEAVACGLATAVVEDPLAHARALAAELVGKSPAALAAAKRLMNQANAVLDGDAQALLQAESDEQVALMGSPHQLEAVRAGLEKREARFG
ncbi:MAG: crotonase/enoyl-CoA hydratase family protein [Aquabacterium sp.]